jgi:threonine/homoserine/homoserine lactone efflux protein
MSESQSFSTFVLTALSVNVTPGPGMMYVAATSVREGTRRGVIAAMGLATGITIVAMGVSLGVGGILLLRPALAMGLRFVGGAYLAWLGVKQLLGALRMQERSGTRRAVPARGGRAYVEGIIISLLNPAILVFLVAMLPQFVEAERPGAWWRMFGLGVLFAMGGCAVNLVVASGAVAMGGPAGERSHAAAVVQSGAGLLLVSVGVRILLQA